jgi:hypothetical protein
MVKKQWAYSRNLIWSWILLFPGLVMHESILSCMAGWPSGGSGWLPTACCIAKLWLGAGWGWVHSVHLGLEAFSIYDELISMWLLSVENTLHFPVDCGSLFSSHSGHNSWSFSPTTNPTHYHTFGPHPWHITRAFSRGLVLLKWQWLPS